MPFDFTAHMSRLIEDIVLCCPDFGHIDSSRLLTCFSQTRAAGMSGLYAKICPLRFEGGVDVVESRGRVWQMPRVEREGRDILYLVYFYVPRFCDLGFEAKLVTTFHELHHVSPDFNGDLRRFPGKNYAHGHSRDAYNDRMRRLVERYLALPPTNGLMEPLRGDFKTLLSLHGEVVGRTMPMPKPRPVVSGPCAAVRHAGRNAPPRP